MVRIFGILILLIGLISGIYLVTTQKVNFRPHASNSSNSNFVVFMMDDLDEASLKELLDAKLLPNIQNYIINRGVRFKNSFVTDSICCASRATFLSGKYPHNSGVWNVSGNEAGYRGFIAKGNLNNNLATWLHDSGYYVGHIGKVMNTYESGETVKPGYDFWRNIRGYDARPGMYRVTLDNNSTSINPDVYQAKYIGDQANEFLSSSKAKDNNFFLMITPTTPHIAVAQWAPVRDTPIDALANPTGSMAVAYHIFDHPDANISNRQMLIVKNLSSGYSIYGNDYLLSTNSWSGWKKTGDDNLAFPNTNQESIVAFSAFVHPDTKQIRQFLIRGTTSKGFTFYYRDFVSGKFGPWQSNGSDSQVVPNTGNLPIAGFSVVNLDGNIGQYLLRGTKDSGYSLYLRARLNGAWTPWQKEPDFWDLGTGAGAIGGFSAEYIGNGVVELNIVRPDDFTGKYTIYRQRTRSFYVTSSPTSVTKVQGTSSDKIAVRPDVWQEESDASVIGVPSNKQSSLPQLLYGNRVWADGNWINRQSYQGYSLSDYGGTMPAGSLRQGNDPNGFSPKSKDFDLPAINSSSFNYVDCKNDLTWICNNWPDLNSKVIGGKTQLDYLRRSHLDRLEAMRSIDVMIGKVMKKLEDTGQLDNTTIIFTSDNGYLLGTHRLSNKTFPYEESIHVPLIIRPAKSNYISPQTNNNTVLNNDLAPTILEYASMDWKNDKYGIDGRSLKELINNPSVLKTDWRKRFLIEYHYPRPLSLALDNPGWYWAWAIPDFSAIRTGLEAKGEENRLYIEYTDDPQITNDSPYREFFDMNTDPYQIKNLYSQHGVNSLNNSQELMSEVKSNTSNLVNCSNKACRDLEAQ